MNELEIIAKTGLSKHSIVMYRCHCGMKGKTEWGDEALRKLEVFLKLGVGVFGGEGDDKGKDVVLVVSRIYPNPSILGVREEGSPVLQRCRCPVQRRYRVGMKVLGRKRGGVGDLWDYVGMVKGR